MLKLKITIKNINFFDFAIQLEFQKKSRFLIINASFLLYLNKIAANYKNKSILAIFF